MVLIHLLLEVLQSLHQMVLLYIFLNYLLYVRGHLRLFRCILFYKLHNQEKINLQHHLIVYKSSGLFFYMWFRHPLHSYLFLILFHPFYLVHQMLHFLIQIVIVSSHPHLSFHGLYHQFLLVN